MAEPTEIECIEPDSCFQFETEEDVRQNPRVLYVKPGNEWADMEKLYAYLQTVISAGA